MAWHARDEMAISLGGELHSVCHAPRAALPLDDAGTLGGRRCKESPLMCLWAVINESNTSATRSPSQILHTTEPSQTSSSFACMLAIWLRLGSAFGRRLFVPIPSLGVLASGRLLEDR